MVQSSYAPVGSIYEAEARNLTLVLAGELLITRPLKQYREREFLSLVGLLQSGDATFGNLEMLFHDFEHPPSEQGMGAPFRADPALLDDVRWMGFDLVACAINHAGDYTTGGVITNKRHVDRAGLINAGTGLNLQEARLPAYFDSPAGRIGLVSATDHVNVPAARASHARAEVPGRPGANTIRITRVHRVPSEIFEQLREIDRTLGFRATRQRMLDEGRFPPGKGEDTEDRFHFGPGLGDSSPIPIIFERADEIAVTHEPDPADVEANLAAVVEAKNNADWVIFSLHSNLSGASGDLPSSYQVELCHRAVDAGADVVAGHGLHRDKGIEVYNGAPIFHSLGDFVLQSDTISALPAEAFERYGLPIDAPPSARYAMKSRGGTVGEPVQREKWESFVARVHWRGGDLDLIELHAVDLGMGRPSGQRGRPVLASAEVADSVFERLQRCSAPFGTVLRRDGPVAYVELR